MRANVCIVPVFGPYLGRKVARQSDLEGFRVGEYASALVIKNLCVASVVTRILLPLCARNLKF